MLAKSAKIEAAYGAGFASSLGQVSGEFDGIVEEIRSSLDSLRRSGFFGECREENHADHFRGWGHKWTAIVRDPQARVPDRYQRISRAARRTGAPARPGGSEIFPAVFSALSSEFDPSKIAGIFASHQDPDIVFRRWPSGSNSTRQMKCHVSWLWGSFIPHFGGKGETFVPLPDEGAVIPLAGLQLQAVPAHYLHSSGNLHLYDRQARSSSPATSVPRCCRPRSRALRRGFSSHIRFAEGFHRRWMGSNEAKRQWCERVSHLEIDMLCPQHGRSIRAPTSSASSTGSTSCTSASCAAEPGRSACDNRSHAPRAARVAF